ncbi:MAG: methyltransferase domain-containing protein [Deltaproteobacteria bacterium]|jgi:predicted nicotinamide N-methyase|nr:methyltransferase domain-containing protein [Deltaproteobacteria bacterium]
MLSLKSFYDRYETEATEIVVAGRKYQILIPRDLHNFINPEDVLDDFPLWAKLWKASWILADFLAQRKVNPDEQLLEIGGGLGLVSIVGFACGHRMTMTEYNPHALQFAKANAHLNNCAQLPVVSLDWYHPNLSGSFDTILASEVIYRSQDFAPLLNLFQSYLTPSGEIILASEMRKTSGEFYKLFQSEFDISILKKVLRSDNEETVVTLFRLRPKTP